MALNSADCVPIILTDVLAVTPAFVMVFPLRSTESELASHKAVSPVTIGVDEGPMRIDPDIVIGLLIIIDIFSYVN